MSVAVVVMPMTLRSGIKRRMDMQGEQLAAFRQRVRDFAIRRNACLQHALLDGNNGLALARRQKLIVGTASEPLGAKMRPINTGVAKVRILAENIDVRVLKDGFQLLRRNIVRNRLPVPQRRCLSFFFVLPHLLHRVRRTTTK